MTLVRPLLLPAVALVLLTALSGCLTFDEHGNPRFTDSQGRTITHVYAGVWSGTDRASASFTVDTDHDFLLTNLVHQGQWFGYGPVLTAPDGTEMESRQWSYADEQYVVMRAMPGTAGTGSLEFPNRNGATVFNVVAVDGYDNAALFNLVHQGVHASPPAPFEGEVSFYVPQDYGSLVVSLVHQGETFLGMTLYDPDGHERAAVESGSGQEVTGEITDAQSGIWTLTFEGWSSGQFVASVVPVADRLAEIGWDIEQ